MSFRVISNKGKISDYGPEFSLTTKEMFYIISQMGTQDIYIPFAGVKVIIVADDLKEPSEIKHHLHTVTLKFVDGDYKTYQLSDISLKDNQLLIRDFTGNSGDEMWTYRVLHVPATSIVSVDRKD